MEMHSFSMEYIRWIHDNLELLITQWRKYVEKKQSGGIRERARRLIETQYDYDQLSGSLSKSVNQLGQDWVFLQMLVESMFRSDAAEFMQNKSLTQDIDSLAGELHRDICLCANQYEKYYLKRPLEMLSLLGDCQRKTDELSKAVIRAALVDLSSSTIHAKSPDFKFWKKFVPYVGKNLLSFKDVGDGALKKTLFFLHKELGSITSYLGAVQQSLSSDVRSDQAVDAFLTHVASVVLRIAVQSCRFWFNRTDPEIAQGIAMGFVDLHQEIDPTNPEFLQLNLSFQAALHKINYKRTATGESDLVGQFCNYLIIWVGKEDLRKQLMSLVTLFINNTLKDGEDAQSYFAEVKAALGEAAFSLRKELQEATSSRPTVDERNSAAALPPCSDLLAKICLLKVELFLKEQLNTSPSLMPFSDDHSFHIDVILTDLREFTKDLSQQGSTEYVKQGLILIEELVSEVEYLRMSFLSKRITDPLVKHSLLQLLFKIVFFKAESFLIEFMKSSDTLITREKDQIESLFEDLEYFKRIVRNKLAKNSKHEEMVIVQIESVARGITLFSYSFWPDPVRLEKMILSLPQLLEKVKIIKAKLGEIRQQFPKSIFPKTFELGFIDFLGKNIRDLLKHDPESIAPVKHHLEEVRLRLESLKSFLVKVNDSDVEQGELKDLGNHILNVAYKLEYVVESIEIDGHLQQSLWLYDLLEDIRLVDQRVSRIHEMPCPSKVQNLPQISHEMKKPDTMPAVEEMVVDLGDEEDAIITRLTRGSSKRDVVCIVGMPGSGKTTLAKRVFNNKNVMCHFPARAWCTVSQVYSKRELLLEILSYIHVLPDKIDGKTDDDLQLELRRKLLGKKYLIVMDDVWDIGAWNDLNLSFPDEGSCRILITSRDKDVESKIKSKSNPHFIRPLKAEESWELLKKKIFKGEACPEELLHVGMEIAQHCQGLPLAVVTIAGLLREMESSKDCWEKISKCLSTEIINDPKSRCREILELSYKHLPEYLKVCFLYLGALQENIDIPVRKLIRCWMAEGFIQETKSKSLRKETKFKSMEEVAEEYLQELINRSLVNISKTRSNGKVKACRLHDLLRELCHLKAKNENFLQLVTRNDLSPLASFPEADHGREFDIKNHLTPVSFESYRLSFYLNRRDFIDSSPSGPGARSLIFSASADSEPKCPYDITFICRNFKLLRVMDLESICIEGGFPVEIGLMVQLRYLAVSGYMQSIPPSIASLWKLETLIVKGLRGKVILPETIWSMTSLRHLHVNNHVAFRLNGLDEQAGGSFELENLVSFSTPSLSCGEDTLSLLKRMRNLKKLRCIFLPSWDFSEDCNEFPALEFLTHLESLKIIYYGGVVNSGEFILPTSLEKLTLSKFRLQGNQLSMIGELPNLKVLKLHGGTFEEQTWEMKEEEFTELLFLELDSMNIAKWEATCDHLPSLEQLVLRNCRDLEGIPSEFADMATLQLIEVQWCGKSVEASAQKIGDQTEEIKVRVSSL